MLTVRPKITELTFRLFSRSLHPELFTVFASRTIERADYSLDVAVTGTGHVISWRSRSLVLSEVASSNSQLLPSARELMTQRFGSPQECRLNWRDRVDYSCDFSLEPVAPQTFAGIQNQLLAAPEYEGLVFQFQASGRMAFGGVSYVDIQSRQQTVSIRAFHTFPDASVVAKSETTFTLRG